MTWYVFFYWLAWRIFWRTMVLQMILIITKTFNHRALNFNPRNIITIFNMRYWFLHLMHECCRTCPQHLFTSYAFPLLNKCPHFCFIMSFSHFLCFSSRNMLLAISYASQVEICFSPFPMLLKSKYASRHFLCFSSFLVKALPIKNCSNVMHVRKNEHSTD